MADLLELGSMTVAMGGTRRLIAKVTLVLILRVHVFGGLITVGGLIYHHLRIFSL